MTECEEDCRKDEGHEDWCCWCPDVVDKSWAEMCERCKGYPPLEVDAWGEDGAVDRWLDERKDRERDR